MPGAVCREQNRQRELAPALSVLGTPRALITRPLSTRWTVPLALYGLYVVGAALDGFWRSFSVFQSYDDEGYVLLSIKEFIHLGGLYNHVYTQYGPFPYELWGAVYKVLGLTVTPDNARLFVIVLWVGYGLVAGLAVQRATGSLAAGLVAAVVTHSVLIVITNEPLIPDDLSAVLLMATAAAGVLIANHGRLRMLSIGALVAALLLTKINIGGAALVAVITALAVHVPGLARRPVVARLLIVLGVLMPLAVMAGDFKDAWAQNLAVVSACGIAGVGVTLWPLSMDDAGARLGDWLELRWFVGAFIAAVLLLVIVILALGTSPGKLIDGVIIWPLNQPNAYQDPAYLPGLEVELSAVGLLLAVVARRVRTTGPIAGALAGAFRVVVGLAVLLEGADLLPLSTNSEPTTFALAVPFLWLAISPVSGIGSGARFGRTLITMLPVYGLLFVYPVAGSQNGYAAAAFVPAATVILVDGTRQLLATLAGFGLTVPSAGRMAGGVLVAVLGFQTLLQPAVYDGDNYASLTPLPFAGVTHVRQVAATEQTYAGLVQTLQRRCPNFVTYPGMNSFYLWTGEQPPTGLNATDWMQLLNVAQQRQIVAVIEKVRHLCLISNPAVLADWTEVKQPPVRPLLKFVTASDFKPIYSAGGYTISVRY